MGARLTSDQWRPRAEAASFRFLAWSHILASKALLLQVENSPRVGEWEDRVALARYHSLTSPLTPMPKCMVLGVDGSL